MVIVAGGLSPIVPRVQATSHLETIVVTPFHHAIEKMAESGCYKLFMAIESGDEYVLKHVIRKPLKLKNVPILAKKIHIVG